jgi:two-component system, sensor histidine kinase and response regulator
MIRCLIIDDNSFDRKALRRAARDCQLTLHICEAVDIRSAERILTHEHFDCLILDFLLPDGDGLSFARRRLATAERQIPIIMLTGKGSEQVAREAFQLGILDYLTKETLSPENLERVVVNALAKVELQRVRQAAQDELKRSNQALRRFILLAAHDLRAPLLHIKTSCDALVENHSPALDEAGQTLVLGSGRAADRACKLIDSLFAYANLGKAGVQRDQVDLRTIVEDAIANLTTLIGPASAMIEIGDLPVVLGEEPQLTQLFQNLISNSLKFRDRERPLVIRVDARSVAHDTWELSVEDNGIGIARENQERIFDIFERLHNHDQYEGTGIGLAACKQIVENLGGRIWCQSAPGTGSTFVFTLPQGTAMPAS